MSSKKRHIDITDAAEKLFESYIMSGISPKTWYSGTMWLTHMRQVCLENLRVMRYTDPFVESLVSALQGLFVNHNISVSYKAIPRRLDPPTSSTPPVPVKENVNHIVDPDPLFGLFQVYSTHSLCRTSESRSDKPLYDELYHSRTHWSPLS
jgi:hypothetical protein